MKCYGIESDRLSVCHCLVVKKTAISRRVFVSSFICVGCELVIVLNVHMHFMMPLSRDERVPTVQNFLLSYWIFQDEQDRSRFQWDDKYEYTFVDLCFLTFDVIL